MFKKSFFFLLIFLFSFGNTFASQIIYLAPTVAHLGNVNTQPVTGAITTLLLGELQYSNRDGDFYFCNSHGYVLESSTLSAVSTTAKAMRNTTSYITTGTATGSRSYTQIICNTRDIDAPITVTGSVFSEITNTVQTNILSALTIDTNIVSSIPLSFSGVSISSSGSMTSTGSIGFTGTGHLFFEELTYSDSQEQNLLLQILYVLLFLLFFQTMWIFYTFINDYLGKR